MAKVRIDSLLVEKGHFETREKAKTSILEGIVYIKEVRVDKPGEMVNEDSEIVIRGEKLPFVSRGGLKLDKAIKVFNINVANKTCMDIGASTGGFTDCMLQNNARFVYAIDVGYGQFAWKLRQDERVKCMEKTNFRYLTNDDISDTIDFFACDVSFISLTKILPVAYNLLSDIGEGVCLIKPQFEAGREQVGKKGVVKDTNVHIEVIEKIVKFAIDIGFNVKGLDYSPIKGPEGNIEFLLYITKEKNIVYEYNIEELVKHSHEM